MSEHMVPWSEDTEISVESLARALKTYQEAEQRHREFLAEEFEIVLPIGVFPDLKDVEGIKVTHHIACPEGQALVLCKGVLQRQFEGMMHNLFSWPRGHWDTDDRLRSLSIGRNITNA